MNYPKSYDEFKEAIIKAFVENEWQYNGTVYSKKEKQEFINNHNFDFKESYEEECENYDEGRINVFENPEEAQYHILGLLYECSNYLNSTHTESYKKVENEYPMTFDEFKKILVESFIERSKNHGINKEDALNNLENYYKEHDPSRLKTDYVESCHYYDKILNGEEDYPLENVFTKGYINSKYGYQLDQWINVFGL